jgi:hypothetical protein
VPTGALISFLKQFHNLNARWGNYYENITEDLVTLCADIQKDIIMKSRRSGQRLAPEGLLIAQALRILALSKNLEEIWGHSVYCKKEEFVENIWLDPETVISHEVTNPSVRVSRVSRVCPTDNIVTREHSDGLLLSKSLQDLVRNTLDLIIRGRPSYWPTIFCVLIVLKLIQSNSSSGMEYFDEIFDGADRLRNVWKILCEMFDLATGGNHPLVNGWARDEYALQIGSKHSSVEHFQILNSIWVDEGLFY